MQADVSDEEWAFAALYLTPMKEGAPQRQQDLRAVFNCGGWSGVARRSDSCRTTFRVGYGLSANPALAQGRLF